MHRLSPESAMANFTQLYSMPSRSDLISIGAEHSTRELEIGTLIRLQSRAQAKLIFTEDVRLLFGNLAYTGPLSHEALYRNVTTLGVNYYAYNKGKKSRKVYVQGDLVRLPVEMGVVKNGAQAMFLKEIGSTFVLYKPQVLSIYIGRIVFEGNSIGSFIETEYVCKAFNAFRFPALHSTRPSPGYDLSMFGGNDALTFVGSGLIWQYFVILFLSFDSFFQHQLLRRFRTGSGGCRYIPRQPAHGSPSPAWRQRTPPSSSSGGRL
jgi:hypothetical protein